MICAGTGKCKTTWVKQVLWPYCETHGFSLYVLANRSMLRDDIQQGTDMPVLTYQLLEQASHEDHPAWNADVVVLDECHSLASDICLDYRRNKILRLFKNKHTLLIGLTATPIDCVTRLFDNHLIYTIPRDCSQLETVTAYYRARDTRAIIDDEISRGGKVLCFIRSSRKGKILREQIQASAFVCSRNAQQWNADIEKHKKQISQTRNWGNDQVLISTKVLDNGVSIEDPQVTAVIVETHDYAVDLIQMLGRIRCTAEQRIRLYIRITPNTFFVKQKNQLQLALIKSSEQNDSLSGPYEKPDPTLLLYNGCCNEMGISYFKYLIRYYESILDQGAIPYISEQLCHIPVIQYTHNCKKGHPHVSNVCEARLLAAIEQLQGIKHDDLKQLLTPFEDAVQARLPVSSSGWQPKANRKNVQRLFELCNLPYTIRAYQYSSGTNRGKRYYMLEKHAP